MMCSYNQLTGFPSAIVFCICTLLTCFFSSGCSTEPPGTKASSQSLPSLLEAHGFQEQPNEIQETREFRHSALRIQTASYLLSFDSRELRPVGHSHGSELQKGARTYELLAEREVNGWSISECIFDFGDFQGSAYSPAAVAAIKVVISPVAEDEIEEGYDLLPFVSDGAHFPHAEECVMFQTPKGGFWVGRDHIGSGSEEAPQSLIKKLVSSLPERTLIAVGASWQSSFTDLYGVLRILLANDIKRPYLVGAEKTEKEFRFVRFYLSWQRGEDTAPGGAILELKAGQPVRNGNKLSWEQMRKFLDAEIEASAPSPSKIAVILDQATTVQDVANLISLGEDSLLEFYLLLSPGE